MAKLKLDELNVITENRRSLPYTEYFRVMALPEREKKKRIRFAEDMEDIMWVILTTMMLMRNNSGAINRAFMVDSIVDKYTSLLEEQNLQSEELQGYVRDFAENLVDSTITHIDDPYYLSDDRVIFVSENESNTIFNHNEFLKAVAEGKRKKTWVTQRDNRVRGTHMEVDGVTIPINDYFVVGDSLMQYPRDINGSPDEVINCRCVLKFR